METKEGSSSENNVNIGKNNEENTGIEHFLPGFKSLEEFRQAGFKALMEATRNSNMLPNGQSWDYYTSYPSFKKIMDAEGSRVLQLISMVLKHQGLRGNIVRRDFEEKFDLIVDANDMILERVGCNLDEMSGVRRNPEPVLVEAVGSSTRPVSGSWNISRVASKTIPINTSSIPQPLRLLTAKNIQRPQAKFKDKISNSSSPFEPRIKDKPNSLKPLSVMLELSEDGEECFSHPYEYELDRFSPSPAQLKQVKPRTYKPLEDTPLIMVYRADQLPGLLQDLARYSEIAVDLEHHSYRSFQGITCLMQISTRDTDYIIDTLELRDELHCLNEIFTKRSITKVFHGADHDIEWLQRDLCVYVVNMFDTHQAAKLLNFAQLSLAFLLKHYCNVVADKHFQLADWRIRPLPEELLVYARQDTHYLLYIYDMMTNDLLDAGNGLTNLLQSAYQHSTQICKKRYEKPILREDSHMLLYRRNKKLFDNRQLYALRELYRWRDKISRDDDESTGYVLPNHMMLQIAETLPREMQGILACCNPIPPLVRQNLLALHQIILQARDQPLIKPVLEEELRTRAPAQTWLKVNLEGALHCPHDLTHKQDFRDDLPTLLGSTCTITETHKSVQRKPIISVFEAEISDSESDTSRHVTFVCPYERYKRVKPFTQSQEAETSSTDNVPAVNGVQVDEENTDERIQRIKDHFLEMNTKMKQEKEGWLSTRQEQPTAVTPTHIETAEQVETLRSKVSKKRKRHKTAQPQQNNGETQDEKKMKLEESNEVAAPLSHSTPKSNMPQGKQKKNKWQEEGFQPFDFSKVNFGRFQGGSKTSNVNQNDAAKSKFKGKKGRKFCKKNNKSMTFGKDKW